MDDRGSKDLAQLITAAIAYGAIAQASINALKELLQRQGISIDDTEYNQLCNAKFDAIRDEMRRLQTGGDSSLEAIEMVLHGQSITRKLFE